MDWVEADLVGEETPENLKIDFDGHLVKGKGGPERGKGWKRTLH